MKKLSMNELHRKSVSEFKESAKLPIIVVLDNIRSLHNIGSVFRTSDGFAIEAIHLCGICAIPPNKEINKTALGATETVNWHYFNTTDESIQELKKQDYTIIIIEQTSASIPLNTFKPEPNKKYALVFGNEVEGVSDSILNQCDAAIEIPQFGVKHSFNISVCAGIIIWDFYSKLNYA